MMNFVWGGVAIFAAIAEVATTGLVSIWFIPGALIALLLSFLGISLWVQIAVFLAVSGISLVVFLKCFKNRAYRNKKTRLNADRLIGEHGVVTSEINNLSEKGEVKVQHQIWSARASEDGCVIPVDAIVEITEISGVKLICKPIIK